MIRRPLEQKVIDFDKVYGDCNRAQKEAVDRTEGTVMVVAGPGTGKTQLLAARIANIIRQGLSTPDNILCLTYTDAGTIAMRERLLSFIGTDAYRVNIYTFHAFCNSVIQDKPHHFGFSDLRPASDLEKTEIVQKLLDGLPHDNPLARDRGDLHSDAKNLLDLFAVMKRENWDASASAKAVDDYLTALPDLPEMRYKQNYKQFKAGDLKVDALQAETRKFERTRAAVQSFDIFQQLMRDSGRYDFDDMIIWVIDAFRKIPELLLDYQERYQYVLVDEYQDTSGAQNEVVSLLMGYWENPNLFVVGDDDQSIYRFQGANIGNILSFEEKYAPYTVVLTENYRSTQQILDSSMAFIAANRERLAGREVAGGPAITKVLRAARMPAGSRPEIRAYPSTTQEALGIALELEMRYQRGDDLSRVAVLYRSHRQAELIIRYLKNRGVPYSTRRRENVLATPIVEHLLGILTYLDGEARAPHSQERQLFITLQHPALGLSPLEVARLYRENERKDGARVPVRERLPRSACAGVAPLIETAIAEIGAFPLQEYVHRVLAAFGILRYIGNSGDTVWQMTALTTFFNFIREESAKSPRLKLEELLRSVDTMRRRDLQLPADRVEFDARGVNFITCHSAKGLEFATVYLVGCNEGEWEKKRSPSGFALPPALLPQHESAELAGLEELRRLFYVAMTRAEQELVITYASRTDSDKELARSRFVAELEKTLTVNPPEEQQLESGELEAALPYLLMEQPAELGDLFTSDLVGEWLTHYEMSFSHLNSYLKCPRTFFFESLLRVPQVKNAAMAFGTSVHAALEHAFKVMKESADQLFPPVDSFIARFEKEMFRNQDAFDDVSFARRLKTGGDCLRRFYELNRPLWHKKVLLEEKVEAVLDGKVPLIGLVDKLEIYGSIANIVDYKTGRYDKTKFQPPDPAKVQKAEGDRKEPKFEHLYGGDYWRQGIFYKLLVENSPKHHYQVGLTQFCFVEPDEKSGEFINHAVAISPEDEEIVRRQIVDTYGRIMAREFGGRCSNSYCAWCR